MNIANRAIKAKPKVNPDRLTQDLNNTKVIKDQTIFTNDVQHIAESDSLHTANLPDGNISVPLLFWLEHKQLLANRPGVVGVQIAADQSPADIVDDLAVISMVVLPMAKFVDGRSYSHARNLRRRFHYQGEIRAVGDVHLDQLAFLARVGCNAFELADDEDHQAAVRAFGQFSEVYQPAQDDQRLIFARRRNSSVGSS